MKTANLFAPSRKPASWTVFFVFTGFAAPLCAQPQTATASVAAEGRMTQAKFVEFVRLVDSNDPRSAGYYTVDVAPSTDAERKAVLQFNHDDDNDRSVSVIAEELYIDDQHDSMAAIMAVRQVAKRDGVQLGSRPQPARAGDALVSRRIVFFGLSNGKISWLRAATDRELPPPAPALPVANENEPMPATATEPLMSRAKFNDYLRLFTRWDKRFAQYYDPDVIFDTQPAPQPLHGRQAIVDLYTPIRRNLDEHITAGTVVVDNARGMMVAEIRNRMTAERGDVPLPSGVMKRGAVRDRWGVILYNLKDGRISRIRGGAPAETFEPAASR